MHDIRRLSIAVIFAVGILAYGVEPGRVDFFVRLDTENPDTGKSE